MVSIQFEVVETGDIVAKKRGRYVSFPSIARDPKTKDILILYREARYDPKDERPGMKAHGLEGSLYIQRYHPGQTQPWDTPSLFVDGALYPPGLIDGVLTTWANRLHVVVRGFPRKVPAYYAYGPSLDQLGEFRAFPSRYKLRKGAEWGRMVASGDGKTLFQVYYGGPHEMYRDYLAGKLERTMTRPALYVSGDSGQSWHFRSWISPLMFDAGLTADETALVYHQGVLYAMLRTMGEDPGPLFLTKSHDLGKTWETPWRSGLYGQAPVFYKMPGGPVLFGMRGYQQTPREENGNFSLSVFSPETLSFSAPFVVAAYKGNRYDGGYGDMIWLPEEQRLLTVYYYSNSPKTRNPWLKYSFVSIR